MPADAFVTFDAPGVGAGSGQGTYAFAINPSGAVTGYYYDANFVGHGFVRTKDGTITTFDAPDDVGGTYSFSVNPEGATTGYYCDAVNCHGFVRTKDGTITTFDAPDDVNGTYPYGINPAGVITGYYIDANVVFHGFVRDRDGAITIFDAPGAGTTAPRGTFAYGINPAGTVSGCYADANFVGHGFLRTSDGTLTTYDFPDSGDLQFGCFLYFVFNGPGFGINPAGAITGSYVQPIQLPTGPFYIYHGLLRSPDGALTSFDAATYSPCCIFTFGIGINPAGTITGYYNDGFNDNHGFVRTANGTVTTLDAQGASTFSETSNFDNGTIADAINPAGTITGYYFDTNSVAHGFVVK